MHDTTVQPTQHRTSSLITENIALADKNWFATGGPARFFAEPTSAEEFAAAMKFAQEHQLETFVLGEGANILISDDGFPGLVIRPRMDAIEITGDLVRAGAGTSIQKLIDTCLAHQLVGLEEFSGIPGTIGGAVYINIHYFEFLLSQFLEQATIIEKRTGVISVVTNDWFNFGYDTSTLHAGTHLLVDATFKLKKIDPLSAAYARGRRDEIIRHRRQRYPTSHTCGSFFRNFLPHEVPKDALIYAAYYLDKLGIKGSLAVGDAIVSHKHANMLVNRGNATSTDLVTLARTMQERVRKTFGVLLQPECQLIGFVEYPLLRQAT